MKTTNDSFYIKLKLNLDAIHVIKRFYIIFITKMKIQIILNDLDY